MSLVEMVIIGLVILLFFGARRLPEIARSVGKSIYEFKKSLKSQSDDENRASGREDGNQS